MRCERCDRTLEGNSGVCPWCGAKVPSVGSVATGMQSDGAEVVGPIELVFNGAMAGMFYGTIIGFAAMAFAHLAGAITAVNGPTALVMGLIYGAGAGAIVGIATVLAQSVVIGAIGGFAVDFVLRVVVMASVGLWWKVGAVSVLIALIAATLFGFGTATLAHRAIDWDRAPGPPHH